MNTSRLKTLVAIIWGVILLVGGALIIFTLTSKDLRAVLGMNSLNPASAPRNAQTSASPSAAFPTRTPTPPRQIIYLPSATARPVSPTPIPPTNTPITPLPIARFYPVKDGNPLTGQTPEATELLNRRPVAVKITNFPRGVRAYQSGVTRADIVFEYYIEDGLTRFIAVFYGRDAERAGPVRSGRYFDEHIMRMFHAPLVFANADERVETYLVESDLKQFLFVPRPDNCPPLCRDTTIEGYNNVFVDTAGVGAKIHNNSKQNIRATFFGPLFTPMSFPVVNHVALHFSIYSYGFWQYDPVKLLYMRYSDADEAANVGVGETYLPHIDHLNEKQVSADNVIVLVVPHNFKNEFDRSDQVFDITLIGSGPAYVFREGRMIKCFWVRDQIDQQIKLVDDKNSPIPLQPGVTFYEIINPESQIVQDGEKIDFFFEIPLRVVTPTPTPKGFIASPTPKKKK